MKGWRLCSLRRPEALAKGYSLFPPATWTLLASRESRRQVGRRQTCRERKQTMKTRLVVSLIGLAISFALPIYAQEKKKLMGTNKQGPVISQTVVPLGPGDDPKHKLTVLSIRRDTTTSPDPDHDGTEQIVYEQADEVAGTGTVRGYF